MYQSKIQKLLTLACCLLTVGCTKNDYSSYCPTWLGFTYKTGNYPNYVQGNPRKVILHSGDSIHITAHQDKRGHLINATYYTWTICYDTIDIESGERVHAKKSYDRHTNYDGYADGADDPICFCLLMLCPQSMESPTPLSSWLGIAIADRELQLRQATSSPIPPTMVASLRRVVPQEEALPGTSISM